MESLFLEPSFMVLLVGPCLMAVRALWRWARSFRKRHEHTGRRREIKIVRQRTVKETLSISWHDEPEKKAADGS